MINERLKVTGGGEVFWLVATPIAQGSETSHATSPGSKLLPPVSNSCLEKNSKSVQSPLVYACPRRTSPRARPGRYRHAPAPRITNHHAPPHLRRSASPLPLSPSLYRRPSQYWQNRPCCPTPEAGPNPDPSHHHRLPHFTDHHPPLHWHPSASISGSPCPAFHWPPEPVTIEGLQLISQPETWDTFPGALRCPRI